MRILSTLARRAYRRPVTDADLAAPLKFYREARAQSGFDAGIEMALRALLVSPKFLFRVEKDPAGVAPTDPQKDYMRQQFEEKHTGRGNRHKPLLLVNGGKLEPVSMTAEDAQLLETRKFQVIEIARAFGVPPHMIGETSASTSWGSGIEQMSIGFVRYTLTPHLRRIEQELNRKLWPRSCKAGS